MLTVGFCVLAVSERVITGHTDACELVLQQIGQASLTVMDAKPRAFRMGCWSLLETGSAASML